MKNRFYIVFATAFLALISNAQTLTIGVGAEINVVGDANGVYTTTLDCDGTILIEGSPVSLSKYATLDLDENATVMCGGDFIKDGTRAVFTFGNSTVVMDGTSSSEISGGTTANSTSYNFYNLIINNAAGVTINANNLGFITVRNILTPQSGAFTTNGRLVLNALSATNYARVAYGAGSITGDVRVEKKLTNTNAQWRQLSMPLNETWGNGEWGGSIDLLFDDHTPANQQNVFYWNAIKNPSTTDDAYGWTAAPSGTNHTTALSIYLEGGSNIHNVDQTFACYGNLDASASQSFLLQNTRDPQDNTGADDAALGWNFIPNPWPSLIDVQVLLNATSFQPDYKAVHVYNSLTGNYEAILIGDAAPKISWNPSPNNILNADANIPPFQAFWVKANTAGQNITLDKASMQTAAQKNTANEQFMKAEPEIIRLNVFDQDSAWDQLVIYFRADGTRNFDNIGDAYYLKSPIENHPEFFGREGNSTASIIARQPNQTDSVDVVFKSTKNQSKFYINVDLRELPEDWHVYLKDKKEAKTRELSNGMNLSFEHTVSNDPNRFEVYFTKMPENFTNLLDQKEDEVFAFIRNNNVVLQSVGVSGLASVQVFDAVGRLLQKQTVQINLGEEKTLELKPTNQLIVIQVVVNGEVFVQKMHY